MSDLVLMQPAANTDGREDAQLVRAARRDLAAFEVLYRRYVTSIYRYLYSRVGNAADAQDLTAQVFIEALQGLDGYRERGNFAAWLFTIARHEAADHHRRKHPHLPLDEARDAPGGVGSLTQSENPLGCLVRKEALQRLAALVRQLDDDKQELLRLRFAGGLTYREIGRVVGRSEAAVKMAVHRLLRRLEAEWEEANE
jgi:RNA polymerase sigma-70 factor, ECF subfamily